MEFSLRYPTTSVIHNQPRSVTSDWSPIYKYVWSRDTTGLLNGVLKDELSKFYQSKFIEAVTEQHSLQEIAQNFTEYFSQACQRTFGMKRVNVRRRPGPLWFDAECKQGRIPAIQASERITSDGDFDFAMEKCREYRALKQRKQRTFRESCVNKIIESYNCNKTNMWKLLSTFSPYIPDNGPSGEDLLLHYQSMAGPQYSLNFDYRYEETAVNVLHDYDATSHILLTKQTLENDILNRNFSVPELREIVRTLKNNKASGIDGIPAEFIKSCDDEILKDLCILFNYSIDSREFPNIWTEGVHNSVFKAGNKQDPNNYRGITVLPVFEKIFETAVQKRIECVNEIFCRNDKYNGGFLKGCRTSDNLFVLQSLVERQINLGQSLIVCFVDFAKAFDLVNRNILFYKIIKSGLHGRAIDTLRDLYRKTAFRVKHGGKLSEPVVQSVGVNQGGNASTTIFWEYLADLRDYLDEFTGVCLSDTTISDIMLLNLLWADDLILVSTSVSGTQKQLDGLENFGIKNQTIVNGAKTKIIVFGKQLDVNATYQGKPIEQVRQYKYLGNIVRPVVHISGDLFSDTYSHLCEKARKSIYVMQRNFKVWVLYRPLVCFTYLTLVFNLSWHTAVMCGG